jgi:RND family efflux transporter MFP subunit
LSKDDSISTFFCNRFGDRALLLHEVSELHGMKGRMGRVFVSRPIRPPWGSLVRVFAWLVLTASTTIQLAGCRSETTPPTDVRPVRVMTIQEREAGAPVVLTGTIRAQDEVALAFRLSGRMTERAANRGDRVKAGQLVARLDPQNERNALHVADANLAAAQGRLAHARGDLKRHESLVPHGAGTVAELERAREQLASTQAQVDAAQAQVRFAKDQVGFTELKADADGIVTAVGAEPGEVVSAGRMIVQIARQAGRDAVFDVPAQVIRSVPRDSEVMVQLADAPSVTAKGRIREVAPQADPVTRTFEVKVGLTEPPPAMLLGATVQGRIVLGSTAVLDIPVTALTTSNQAPAVWVVDPSTSTVSLRLITVLRYEPEAVIVSNGLAPGDVVVTAGVQALYPGQKVRLLGSHS